MPIDFRALGQGMQAGAGAYDAMVKGGRDAQADDQQKRQAQEQMMQLALKDANFENSQVINFVNMLKSLPVSNEPRLQQAQSMAADPFSRVQSVQSPGATDSSKLQMYLDVATGKRPDVSLSMPSAGVGARMMDNSWKSGQMPPGTSMQPQASPQMSPMDAAIQRLRDGQNRAPQGTFDQGSIVQPLEGDLPGVQPLEPTQIQGDPNAEQALSFVHGQFKGSPYAAMRDPQFQRMMMDSMMRQGFVNGLGLQTDVTNERLKSLDQSQFIAAKSATQMNQRSGEVSAQLQEQKSKMEIQALEKAADLAMRANDKASADQLKAQVEMLKAGLAVLHTEKVAEKPAAARGGGKEDPNKKDYRAQLGKLQERVNAESAKITAQFPFMPPQALQQMIKTQLKNMPDVMNMSSQLHALGTQKYPDVLQNYPGLFSTFGFSGNPGAKAPSGAAAPAGPSGPQKGQQKKLSSGTVVTFDGSKWK